MCSCVETVSEHSLVKARKDYEDSNKWFVLNRLDDFRRKDFFPSKKPLTFSQWRLIAESIRDKWVIKKGTIHETAVLKMGGYIYQWRTKPGLDKICQQYSLWPEC